MKVQFVNVIALLAVVSQLGAACTDRKKKKMSKTHTVVVSTWDDELGNYVECDNEAFLVKFPGNEYSTNIVRTKAHCIVNLKVTANDYGNMPRIKVLVGGGTYTSNKVPYSHWEYEQYPASHDVGLIQLDTVVYFSKTAKPVVEEKQEFNDWISKRLKHVKEGTTSWVVPK